MNITQVNMNEENDLSKYLMTKIDIGKDYNLKNKNRVLIFDKSFILFINEKQELILMNKNCKKKILKRIQHSSELTLLNKDKFALINCDNIYIYQFNYQKENIYLKNIIKSLKLYNVFETKDNKIITYNYKYDYIYIWYKNESNKEYIYDILAVLFVIYMLSFTIYVLYYFIKRSILKFIIIALFCAINFHIFEKIIDLYKMYKKYYGNIHYKKIYMPYIYSIEEGTKNEIICFSINKNKIIFFDYTSESSKFDELILANNIHYTDFVKVNEKIGVIESNELFYIINIVFHRQIKIIKIDKDSFIKKTIFSCDRNTFYKISYYNSCLKKLIYEETSKEVILEKKYIRLPNIYNPTFFNYSFYKNKVYIILDNYIFIYDISIDR